MATTCPSLSTGEAFLSTLLRHVDCQAQTIGSMGYQGLADPASPVSILLTALLTIFIALFGLRMVLGDTPTLRNGVMAVMKIGVVLVMATSWPAYRTLVYDVIVQGPGQLAAVLGRTAGLPGSDGDLISRLQTADVAILRLIDLGSGRDDLVSQPPQTAASNGPSQRTAIPDNPAFGAARVVFVSGTVAAVAAVRLTAGVLLALAPLFAGLLLFDLARGLVVGWARALLFTLLGSLGTTIILGVELALMEPWLTQVLQLRQARIITAAAPIELLIMSLTFALALLGSLAILLRLAFMVHIPSMSWPESIASPPERPIEPAIPSLQPAQAAPGSSRALGVADAVRAVERRERAGGSMRPSGVPAVASTRASAATANASDDLIIPAFGQGLRRTKPRKSLGAALRDRRS